MTYCSQCGAQNGADAKFCSQCGQRLASPAAAESAPAATGDHTATITFGGAGKADTEERVLLNDDDAAAVDALPEGSALLIALKGPGLGSRYLLDTETVLVGRHPDSDIFLDDITVSRRHAEFRRGPEGYAVHDVGSLNGSYVNRDRIDDAKLTNGDEVRIGKFRLVYLTHNPGRG